MHELGITQNIVAIVGEAAKGRRVRRVTLDVGQLSGIMPDAIAFCFDIVAKGTALDGASLDIHRIPGQAHCRSCGATFETVTLFQACGCGSRATELMRGEELKIRDMEIEEAA